MTPPTLTCDYCGLEGGEDELEPRPRGAGFRCRDAAACDVRDAQRHGTYIDSLRARQREGDDLTDAEKRELADA